MIDWMVLDILFDQTIPLLQFHFLPPSNIQVNNSHGAIFIIDDGCQPKIELASKERNVIAATFTHFLLKNIGGSETFKDKQDFFYHEVRLVRSIWNQRDTAFLWEFIFVLLLVTGAQVPFQLLPREDFGEGSAGQDPRI